MNQLAKLTVFKDVAMFNRQTLQRVLNIGNNALYANIKRWLKKGELIQLKRGWYVTKNYYLMTPGKQIYLEWLANKLKEPSYLSMEYVLQKYNLLSEAVYSITSVSLKKPKSFINNLGQFSYTNINEKLFKGYKVKQVGEYDIKEASLAKALFDYLYYKKGKLAKITQDMWDDLRLNMDVITDEDRNEFIKYCLEEGSKKMIQISKII